MSDITYAKCGEPWDSYGCARSVCKLHRNGPEIKEGQ